MKKICLIFILLLIFVGCQNEDIQINEQQNLDMEDIALQTEESLIEIDESLNVVPEENNFSTMKADYFLWNTYNNEQWGFDFKYPLKAEIVKESDGYVRIEGIDEGWGLFEVYIYSPRKGYSGCGESISDGVFVSLGEVIGYRSEDKMCIDIDDAYIVFSGNPYSTSQMANAIIDTVVFGY